MQAERGERRDEPGIFWAAHQVDLAYSQIERLVNLGSLPDQGFQVACFPLRIEGGSARAGPRGRRSSRTRSHSTLSRPLAR